MTLNRQPNTQQKQRMIPLQPVSLSGDQAPERIVVMFDFTNEKLVPKGIPYVERAGDKKIDDQRAQTVIEAGQADLARAGRVLPHRVTTGRELAKNIPMTTGRDMRTDLIRAGYRLVDAHYTNHQPLDRDGRQLQAWQRPTLKWRVYLTFRRLDRGPLDGNLVKDGRLIYRREVDEGLRELAQTTWAFAQVWDNRPIDSNISLLFIGRQQNAAPHNTFRALGHYLCVEPLGAEIKTVEPAETPEPEAALPVENILDI